MKKHFLLLALAALCSLGVWAVDASWGYQTSNALQNDERSVTVNGMTLTSSYEVDNDAWIDGINAAPGVLKITTTGATISAGTMVITNVTLSLCYADAVATTTYVQFYDADNVALGDPQTIIGHGKSATRTDDAFTAPEGAKSLKVYAESDSWANWLYYVQVTAELGSSEEQGGNQEKEEQESQVSGKSAEWGHLRSATPIRPFPSASSDELNNIKIITTAATTESDCAVATDVCGWAVSGISVYAVGDASTEYLDIQLTSGEFLIEKIDASTSWYNMNIQFASSSTYDSNYNLGSLTQLPHNAQETEPQFVGTIPAPNNARSARITPTVVGQWNALYYLKVYTKAAPSFDVTYAAGGATGTVPAAAKAYEGSPYTLAEPTSLEKTGFVFDGWKSSIDDQVYAAGASLVVTDNVTFTAQWAEDLDDPTITFRDTIYIVDESTLDLSKLFKTNSSGKVTYTVQDAGTTGAAISGTTFTATAGGTAIVTASQARVEGEFNAKSVDATITVKAFADSVDFEYFAGKYGSGTTGVAHVLDSCHYTVTNLNSGVEWDKNSAAGDNGLKFGDWVARELSFFVPANRSVVIKMGVMNQGSSGTTKLFIDGKETTPFVGAAGDYSQGVENGPYITTKETKFEIKVTDPYWTLIQKITIKELKYTITFNPGEGGQGTMDADAEFAGKEYTLPECTFTHTDGKVFDGWKYSENDQIYAENATITMPAKNISFTAQWKTPEEVPHSVTYSAGDGGEWTDSQPTEVDHTEGAQFTLPASSVVARTGYQFAGWNDGTQTYAAGSSYRMPNDNVTLTALWNKLYTVTYVAGCDDYTGTLPTQDPQIDGAKFFVAAAGIKRQGYAFKGWNDTYNTYQPGHEYTMPASNLVFTAQWEPVTVPTVTDLTITEPVNEIVPLSWNIPGLVDMSNYGAPIYDTYAGDDNISLNAGTMTVDYSVVQYGNTGVAFNVNNIKNLETLTFSYTGSTNTSHSLWIGACDNVPFNDNYGVSHDGHAYWEMGGFAPASASLQTVTYSPNETYYDAEWKGDILSETISQIAIYANSGADGTGSFTISNVRYHTTGMSDVEIAKVTLVRKAGSASANPADGDVLIDQQVAFDFTDTQAKEPGKYYYTVFAYDAEGNYSAAVTEEYELVVKQTYTITYAAGGEDVIGEVPVDEMPKVEGTKFNLLAPGSLQKPYCQFNGWSDGTDTYAAGQEYTMPAKNVTFTAQWSEEIEGFRIPENTVRLNYANKAASSTDLGTTYTLDGESGWMNLGADDLSTSNLMAEWNVYITPGVYSVELKFGTPTWNTRCELSLIDPVSGNAIQSVIDEISSSTGYTPGYMVSQKRTTKLTWNLSSLTEGKLYLVRVQEKWGGSALKVHHIDFIPTITIDQDKEDNLIFDGKANVTLIRPLAAGTTNTICLPFALNREQIDDAFGTDAEVWALTSSTLSPDNMTLDIEFEQVEEMAAGVPYLIQPGTGYNASANPVFEEIMMSKTLAPVEYPNLDFIGVVQRSFVSVGFKDHLFVGADNMVYYPQGSDYLNGMRAYFHIKYNPEAEVPAGVSARMILGRTTPTGWQKHNNDVSVRKVLRNGRLHIIRNGVVNDVMGNIVK